MKTSGFGRGQKTGILGGSFNPPHVCHLFAAVYALEALDAGEVWLVPSLNHALGKKLEPFVHRLALCAALIHPYRPLLQVSDFESRQGGTGYTIDLMRDLAEANPNRDFSLILGCDIKAERHLWKEFDAIEREFEILWIGREGSDNRGASITLPNVSSSRLRDALAKGERPLEFIPRRVMDEIELRRMYLPPALRNESD